MRKLARVTLSVPAALSLVLCVGVCVMWVAVGDAKASWALGKIDNPETTEAGFYIRLAAAIIPYWLAALPTVPLPLLWITGRIRRAINSQQLKRVGHCTHCGYDLTGNASGVCPECGTPRERAGVSR